MQHPGNGQTHHQPVQAGQQNLVRQGPMPGQAPTDQPTSNQTPGNQPAVQQQPQQPQPVPIQFGTPQGGPVGLTQDSLVGMSVEKMVDNWKTVSKLI